MELAVVNSIFDNFDENILIQFTNLALKLKQKINKRQI
jgi:hypothetical protein